ncbi:hypothetical protein RP20_CCG011851 [Aedes albopictus]|nr:hypothetical protein RP20_CCG011851 [Aedes albopictus]
MMFLVTVEPSLKPPPPRCIQNAKPSFAIEPKMQDSHFGGRSVSQTIEESRKYLRKRTTQKPPHSTNRLPGSTRNSCNSFRTIPSMPGTG